MNKIAHSLKWVFSTIILRRILSFLLFWYVIRNFSRAEYGVYRQFFAITQFTSILTLFSFNFLNVVEQTKKYFKEGLQFVLISSLLVSLILLCLRSYLANKYNSPEMYYYILFGFWLIIPETLKRLIHSILQLDMNFKLKSIAETANVIVFFVLTIILLLYDKRFYFFVIAFFIGNLVELLMVGFYVRKELLQGFVECITFKHIISLKNLLKERFAFLCLTTAPTVVNVFFSDAPLLLFGIYYTSTDIGNYSAIAQLILIPIGLITLALSQVYFPAFSEVIKKDLPNKILQYIRHIVIILWCPVIIFGILVKYWSSLILGNQDIEIITTILILLVPRTICSLLVSPLSIIPTILKKPQYELYLTFCSLSIICTLVYLLRGYDFVIVISVYAIISTIFYMVFLIVICKMVKLKLLLVNNLLLKGVLYNSPLLGILFFLKSPNLILISVSIVVSSGLIFIFEKNLLYITLKKFMA